MGGWLIPWYYRDLSLRLMTKQNAITAKNPRAVLDKTPFMGGETDNKANDTDYQFQKELLTVYRNGNSKISGKNSHDNPNLDECSFK